MTVYFRTTAVNHILTCMLPWARTSSCRPARLPGVPAPCEPRLSSARALNRLVGNLRGTRHAHAGEPGHVGFDHVERGGDRRSRVEHVAARRHDAPARLRGERMRAATMPLSKAMVERFPSVGSFSRRAS